MKVLLTGSSGFIGNHVVNALKAHNIDFLTIGRGFQNTYQNHIVSDLLTTESFSESIRKANPTHLIHLAWYTKHGKYWQSPQNLEWITATYRLLEAFCEHGGEYALIAGTCAEYDWQYGFCDEELTPVNPNSLYGIAKDSTRRISQLLCHKYNIPIGWARIFFPYGYGETSERLIPSLFSVFRQEQLPFGVNSQSFRDFLHVTDLAEALLTCVLSQAEGVINISSGKPVAIQSIVEIIANIYNQNPSLVLALKATRKGEPSLLIGNNQKLKNLGWNQKIDLEVGLSEY